MKLTSLHVAYTAGLVGALIIVALGWFWFSTSHEDETARVARAVAELAIVPDEIPIITTVTDPTKLADTPLAGEAKVGDKVLFYQNAKRLILYRPSENRIVDIVPFKIGVTPSP